MSDLLAVLDAQFLGPKTQNLLLSTFTLQLSGTGVPGGSAASRQSRYAASFTRLCNGERVRSDQHHSVAGYKGIWEYRDTSSEARISTRGLRVTSSSSFSAIGRVARRPIPDRSDRSSHGVRVQAQAKSD